jgi:hypothetical protein
MQDPQVFRLNRLRRRAAALGSDIEHLLAWDTAVGVAYQERTGLELQDGEPYTPADAARADELILMYPKSGA